MARSKKKIYILDTNVILHDSTCIRQFQENDVILPITVLEELDNFKKGNDSLNYHAREFLRVLDGISSDHIFNGGVKIGDGLGKISVKLEREFHPDIRESLSNSKNDHRILNIAYWMQEDYPKQQIILVSKDVNLRLKAKSISLLAEDYKNDHVEDPRSYTGFRTVELEDDSLVSRLYQEPFEYDRRELDAALERPLVPNEHLILRCGNLSALAAFDPFTDKIMHVEKSATYGIKPRNAEQTFALNALLNDNIKLVSITGKAGTGKTLLALAAALHRRKNYRQILMARPVVPLSNKDLGFLPGDLDSKLGPYMQPLFDNLGVLKMSSAEQTNGKHQVDKFLEEEKLVISPLAYIRGRSLVKIFFIVDEAQNLTPHEVKTIITRAGEDTKIILTGDIFQIDHPYLDTHSNGLTYLIHRMKGQKLYAHINLEKGERSELADLAGDLL